MRTRIAGNAYVASAAFTYDETLTSANVSLEHACLTNPGSTLRGKAAEKTQKGTEHLERNGYKMLLRQLR